MSNRPWVLRQLEPVIHTQSFPMDEVVVQHNKGKLFPIVMLIREDGMPMEAVVDSPNENSIVIRLNQAETFTAYIY
jgi:hypothetical protein